METSGKVAIVVAVTIGAAAGFTIGGASATLDALFGTLVGGFAGFGVVMTLWVALDELNNALREHYRKV